ncbi:hypothetical protein Ddye_023242 [Dipteronia dyeriana]|uniref:Reverse transcriptase n=1 Tax=Dipteronia dyeriana TaxID=168575 RepID=A0AAD9TTJ5_9ROSI|nr:hypothetical protein Ddye_023242 [Dipteronia dyeriana]
MATSVIQDGSWDHIERRAGNRINGLFNSNGTWQTSHSGLSGVVVDYFSEIFRSNPRAEGNMHRVLNKVKPRLSPCNSCLLDRPVIAKKVRCAVFAITPTKAPGPDGLIVSHLFFTDDSLLFSRASDRDCSTIRSLLDDYSAASGQVINFEKFTVCFSNSAVWSNGHRLANIIGVKHVQCHERRQRNPSKGYDPVNPNLYYESVQEPFDNIAMEDNMDAVQWALDFVEEWRSSCQVDRHPSITTDTATCYWDRLIGLGCFIRNKFGTVKVTAINKLRAMVSPFVVVAIVVRQGIQLAISYGLTPFHIETDSL